MIETTTHPTQCHRIKSMSVVGGFLDGLTVELADGLGYVLTAMRTLFSSKSARIESP